MRAGGMGAHGHLGGGSDLRRVSGACLAEGSVSSTLLQLGKWAIQALVEGLLARAAKPKAEPGESHPLSHRDVAHQQAQMASSVAAAKAQRAHLRVVK